MKIRYDVFDLCCRVQQMERTKNAGKGPHDGVSNRIQSKRQRIEDLSIAVFYFWILAYWSIILFKH